MAADITVITVFHNRSSGVDLSMQSLRAQDHENFRVVAMDDGSTDDSYARLQHYRSDRISVQTQPNRGFTATMARLVAEAETEFVAVHGAGDESLPHRLSAQHAFLRDHPEVVAVGCGIENVDEISGRRWPVMPPHRIMKGPIVRGFGISHGELMFRRDAYMRTGGYREWFRYGQATDLMRRLSRIGDFGFVDDVLYRRYLRGDGVNANLAKVAERDIYEALSSAVHIAQLDAADKDKPGPALLKDDLDRYGLLLPYMLPRSKAVATGLARAAVKIGASGDWSRARRLASRSVRERMTAQGAACYLAILAGTFPPLRKPMLRLIGSASRGTAEFDLQRLQQAADRAKTGK